MCADAFHDRANPKSVHGPKLHIEPKLCSERLNVYSVYVDMWFVQICQKLNDMPLKNKTIYR